MTLWFFFKLWPLTFYLQNSGRPPFPFSLTWWCVNSCRLSSPPGRLGATLTRWSTSWSCVWTPWWREGSGTRSTKISCVKCTPIHHGLLFFLSICLYDLLSWHHILSVHLSLWPPVLSVSLSLTVIFLYLNCHYYFTFIISNS